jgi:hypothetical protein
MPSSILAVAQRLLATIARASTVTGPPPSS